MFDLHHQVPNFSLPNQDGQSISLDSFRGKYVLLYFYPKDDTPGCTKEACTLRDNYDEFQKLGVVVLGVSADSPQSHLQFIAKYHLPFTLLSDPEKEVIKLYGAARGPFIKRMSYLINPTGEIVKVYPQVTPANHASEILQDMEILGV